MPDIVTSHLHQAIVATLLDRWFHLPADEREAFAYDASLRTDASEADVATAIGLMAKAVVTERDAQDGRLRQEVARDPRGRFERESAIARGVRKQGMEEGRQDRADWLRLFGGGCPL